MVEKSGRVQEVPDGQRRAHRSWTWHEVSTAESRVSVARLRPRLPEVGAALRLLHRYGQQRVEFHAPRRSPTLDPESAREVPREDFPENHNGGLLLFGPDEATSTGRPGTAAMRLCATRIATARTSRQAAADRSAAPAGRPLGPRPTRSWAPRARDLVGLRNPWRFSFDRHGPVDRRRGAGPARRSTGSPPARARGELRLVGIRGGPSLPRTRGRPDHDHRRSLDARPSLRLRCQRRGPRFVYGRYVYGDYCDGELAASPPGQGAAPRTTGRWA